MKKIKNRKEIKDKNANLIVFRKWAYSNIFERIKKSIKNKSYSLFFVKPKKSQSHAAKKKVPLKILKIKSAPRHKFFYGLSIRDTFKKRLFKNHTSLVSKRRKISSFYKKKYLSKSVRFFNEKVFSYLSLFYKKKKLYLFLDKKIFFLTKKKKKIIINCWSL